MKKISSLFVGAALLACAAFPLTTAAAPAATSAPQAALPLGTIRTIQINAAAAHDNAGIYQWRRVNLEVERIAASEHALEQSSAATAAPAQALRQAVLELRSAWFDHDKARTQAAADQITAQCALLLR